MIRPLYQPQSGSLPRRDEGGHAGLWYDKFCDQWQLPSWTLQAEGKETGSPKLSWINNLAGQVIGVRSELEEMARRLTLVSVQRGGRVLIVRTESRFVTGLGRSHPVENGFAWHPTLGTPYLPGSSIKGMVRAWAEQEADPQADPIVLDRIFGAPGRAGAISFLDGVPTMPVKLEADVLTPHYAAWSPQDPPGDWRAPRPIPFLVTAPAMPLLVALIPCGRLEAADLDRVERWLVEALAWAGAGAKTAIGYGRMALDADATQARVQELRDAQARQQAEIARAERLANLDPLDRELEDIAAAEANVMSWHTWILAVESGRWSNDLAIERRVIDKIVAAMQEALWWKEGETKKKDEKKYKRTQRVKALLAKNQEANPR